tara:strand:- start:2231 stop:2737 length:507 start_codon:yes stop_codon:yes gene_type:complete
MIIPSTPEELTGKEPCLFDLINFIDHNKDYVATHETCDELQFGVDFYYDQVQNNARYDGWRKFSFKLFGYTLTQPNDKLTNEVLKNAIATKEENYDRIKSMHADWNGVSGNVYEEIFRDTSEKAFVSILAIIELYYITSLENLYSPPDGKEYLRCKMRWEEKNENTKA